jgi:hypothetical protein
VEETEDGRVARKLREQNEKDKQVALADKRLGPPTPLVRVELFNYLNDAVGLDVGLVDKNHIMPQNIHETLEDTKEEQAMAWNKADLRKLAH